MHLFDYDGPLMRALIYIGELILLNLLFLLILDMGITGYVMSVVLSDVLITVLLFFTESLWREVDIRALSGKQASAMLRFSIPMIPTTVFWCSTPPSANWASWCALTATIPKASAPRR